MSHDLASLREDYAKATLRRSDVAADPFTQFNKWFSEAQAAGVPEPNAMSLATVDAAGYPNCRVVLLKDLDAERFTFFTNYQGQKAEEMSHGHRAVSLTFLWKELERQVHIRGTVEHVPAAECDAYFAKRPYKSQLGAWASAQSTVLENREALEASFEAWAAKYPEGSVVPRPPHWGGYAVRPYSIEFWQGRRSRLHDRLRYTRALGTSGSWELTRHAP
jgi:pyridoxamine 5'-phosphate oxidase